MIFYANIVKTIQIFQSVPQLNYSFMKSRNFIRLTLFAAAASLASAETLIYDGAENGSFYDGSYWG